jgi:hypothetical protein
MAMNELRTFLRREKDSTYRLETEDGTPLVRGRTYRELRRQMDAVLATLPGPPVLKILIGAPRPTFQRSTPATYLAETLSPPVA